MATANQVNHYELQARHARLGRATAEEDALRDVDDIAAWLCEECNHAEPAPWSPMLVERSAQDFKATPVPQLLALLMDEGQPVNTTLAVRDALVQRYLSRPAVQAHVMARTCEISRELAEAYE